MEPPPTIVTPQILLLQMFMELHFINIRQALLSQGANTVPPGPEVVIGAVTRSLVAIQKLAEVTGRLKQKIKTVVIALQST